MKKPKFTDLSRYPHGYRPANKTDVRETFRRVLRERQAEAEAKVRQFPQKVCK
jgi:hypothetical protein